MTSLVVGDPGGISFRSDIPVAFLHTTEYKVRRLTYESGPLLFMFSADFVGLGGFVYDGESLNCVIAYPDSFTKEVAAISDWFKHLFPSLELTETTCRMSVDDLVRLHEMAPISTGTVYGKVARLDA